MGHRPTLPLPWGRNDSLSLLDAGARLSAWGVALRQKRFAYPTTSQGQARHKNAKCKMESAKLMTIPTSKVELRTFKFQVSTLQHHVKPHVKRWAKWAGRTGNDVSKNFIIVPKFLGVPFRMVFIRFSAGNRVYVFFFCLF